MKRTLPLILAYSQARQGLAILTFTRGTESQCRHPLAEAGLGLCHRNTPLEGEHSISALEKQIMNTAAQVGNEHANPLGADSTGTPEFKQRYCESLSLTDLTHMQSWQSHPTKQSSPLPSSVLLPDASCALLAHVSVCLPSAQGAGIGSSWRKELCFLWWVLP